MDIKFTLDKDEDVFIERVTKDMEEYVLSLRNPNEIEQIVLKTHLSCECLLEEIISNSLPNPNAVLSARYSFANKLALVKAIVGADSVKLEVTAKVETLNKLRNQMAHQINGTKIPELFRKLGIENPDSSNPDSVEEVIDKLAELFGNLIGVKEVIVLQNHKVDYSVENS